jgi:chromosome segregation ATPase
MAEQGNTPEHIVATAKIPVELDTEKFDRQKEQIDAWIDALPRRLREAFNLSEPIEDAARQLDKLSEQIEAVEQRIGRLPVPAGQQDDRPPAGAAPVLAQDGPEFGFDDQHLKDIRSDVRDLKRQVDDVIDALAGLQSIIGEKF